MYVWKDGKMVKVKAQKTKDAGTAKRVSELEKALAEKDTLIADKDAALAEKDTLIADKDAALAEKDTKIAELEKALAEISAQAR